MSDKKTLSLIQRLEAVQAALDAAIAQVSMMSRPSDELIALCLSLQNARIMLNTALGQTGNLNQDMLTKCARRMSAAFRAYRGYYEGLPRSKKRGETSVYNAVAAAAGGFLQSTTGAAAEIMQMLTMAQKEREAYSADLGQSLLQTRPKDYSIAGKPTGIRDMMTANAATGEPEKVFNILLWLGMNEARIRRDDLASPDLLEQNPFHQQYVRLTEELNNAPADVRQRYVQLLIRQSIMNRDALALEYQKILDRVGRENEAQAKKELMATDTYRHAQSFEEMCRRLPGPMGFLIRRSTTLEQGDKETLSVASRHPEVTAILNGPQDAEVQRTQRAKAMQEVSADYLRTELANTAFGILTRMDADEGSRSDSCRAMFRMMMVFGREDHSTIENPDRYLKRLTACERAAKYYLKNHRPEPRTDDGKARVQLANDIVDFCATARAQFNSKLLQRDFAAIHELNTKPIKTFDDLEQIAKFQSYSSTTANINPKVRDVRPDRTKGQRLWGWGRRLLSGLYSTVCMLTVGAVTNTLGILAGAYVYGVQETRATWKRDPKPLDLDHAPGERDAALQDKLHTEKDPETGIFTDIRRVPMTWEREIPDDPNQPPTVSFRAAQPRMGLVADESPEGTGHSYICLRYSKVDPRTGKLQRYETCYGFYPKGGFDSKAFSAAQLQLGYRLPGQLSPDFGYHYSAERTMVVNSEKINRLLVFAQNYEKNGYNLISRNCTTFLAESAKFAGIDLGVSKEDFITGTGTTRLGAALAPVVGNIGLGAVADHGKNEKLNRDDLSYQRFGQKMVSKEDFERETLRSFNHRMRGYSPGAVGQSFLANPNFTIRNQDWSVGDAVESSTREKLLQLLMSPTDDLALKYRIPGSEQHHNILDTAQKYIAEQPLLVSILAIRQQVSALENNLERHLGDRVVDGESVTQALEDYSSYCETVIKALETSVMACIDNKASDPAETLARTSRLLGDFISSTDRYFRVNFQSDADLQVDFQRIAFAAQTLREKVNVNYRSALSNRIGKEAFELTGAAQLRDTAYALRNFIQEAPMELATNVTQTPYQLSMSAIIAIGRVYKSSEEFIADVNASRAGDAENATPEQQKAAAAANRRINLVQEFMLPNKFFTAQKQFNNSDINLLFNTLPKMWVPSRTNPSDYPIREMQCFALEHVFGGLQKSLGLDPNRQLREIQNLRNPTPEMQELEEQVQQLTYELCKLPREQRAGTPIKARLDRVQQELNDAREERENAFQEACVTYSMRTAERLARGINRRMQELTPEQKVYLRTMQVCIAQRLLTVDQQRGLEPGAPPKDYAALAAEELFGTLAGTYCGNMVNGMMSHLCDDKQELMPTTYAPLDVGRIYRDIRIPDFMKAPITGLNQKGPNPTLPAPKAPAPVQGPQRN